MLLLITNRNKVRMLCRGLVVLFALSLAWAAVCGDVLAAKGGHKIHQATFPSPEEGVAAFVAALKADDAGVLLAMFGPDASALISSGDAVADANAREHFLALYQEKNQLKQERPDRQVLEVGADSWPFPIPLVKAGGAWHFDTKAGKEEILNRRIGLNELHTIQACLAFVDAQREYASKPRGGDGVLEYAQKFASDPGKKNGLYWPAGEGEEESPLGPLVAAAKQEGYSKRGSPDTPVPYHGYLFKILTAQGRNASGGPCDYVVKGRMIGGFALVAYPAEYGASGVMTFIVNHQGDVYEKDLGRKTPSFAGAMKAFDPDKTWKKVDPKFLETPGKASAS